MMIFPLLVILIFLSLGAIYFRKDLETWIRKHYKIIVAIVSSGLIISGGYILLDNDTPLPSNETNWYSPSTIANDDSNGESATWSNPSNAGSQSDTYADAAVSGGGNTQYLKFTNFGISIPDGATIDGITVEMDVLASRDDIDAVHDNTVYLVKAGTIQTGGDNKADTTRWEEPDSDTYRSYGGGSDTWNLSLSESDVENSGFGVAISAWAGHRQEASIDHVRIKVSYTETITYNYHSVSFGGSVTVESSESTTSWVSSSFGGSVTVESSESTTSWVSSSFGGSVTVEEPPSWGNWSDWWVLNYGFNTTIRTDGEDYFVWLGDNCTLDNVADNITGFDEAGETISILGDNGHWINLSGTGSSAESVYTFDVVKVVLDDGAGSVTIDMTGNTGYTGNYENRTYTLSYVGPQGVNYTGFSNGDGSTLGEEADKVGFLENGEVISVWDDTNYKWVAHLQGSTINQDQAIDKWDVCYTRISDTETWNQVS